MQFNRFWKSYIATFLTLFIGNFLSQGLILQSHNARYLSGIIKPMSELVFPILIFTYLVHAAVLVFLVSKLLSSKSPKNAFLLAGGYGGMLLFHANIVNIFLLPVWPWQVFLTDVFASFVAFGMAGAVGFLLLPKNNG